jgi:carbon monoxide dehydrogenase subunit G
LPLNLDDIDNVGFFDHEVKHELHKVLTRLDDIEILLACLLGEEAVEIEEIEELEAKPTVTISVARVTAR